jgi:hypothetical protein
LGDIWRSGHGISEVICGTITAIPFPRELKCRHTQNSGPIAQTSWRCADADGQTSWRCADANGLSLGSDANKSGLVDHAHVWYSSVPGFQQILASP